MIAIVGGSAGIDLYGDSGDLEAAIALHDEVVETVAKLWETSTFQAQGPAQRADDRPAGHATSRTCGSAERPGIVRRGDKLLAVAEETMTSQPAAQPPARSRGSGLDGRGPGPSTLGCAGSAESSRRRRTSSSMPGCAPSRRSRRSGTGSRRRDRRRGRPRSCAASGRAAEAKPLTEAATATARELGAEPLLRELRTIGGGAAHASTRPAPAARRP